MANNYGQDCLYRLKKGLSPHSHRDWPVQANKVKEELRFRLRTKTVIRKGATNKKKQPEYIESKQQNKQEAQEHEYQEEEGCSQNWNFSLDGDE